MLNKHEPIIEHNLLELASFSLASAFHVFLLSYVTEQ